MLTAVKLAQALAAEPVRTPGPSGRSRRRWFAMGDPQASIARFFEILAAAGVLADDGLLRDDVGLLSIGDHFDHGHDPAAAARDGLAIVHWLAAHPPDQVVMIAGNHDLSRVIELAHETDASFAAARTFQGEEREFQARHPRIPTPQLASRDYSGFSEAQRTSVEALLTAHRFALAAVAPVDGVTTLLVHAGVTQRELRLLGVAPEAHAIATALNRLLDQRVDLVAPRWSRGERAALDLAPIHLGGTSGVHGAGLLYHRVANLQREGMEDPEWERDPERPHRYDPRSLPPGLVQVVGHTAHKKCVKELVPWVTERARAVANGGLRTLRVGDEIVYDLGVLPPRPGEAVLYLIDGSMSDESVREVPLLPIGAPEVRRS